MGCFKVNRNFGNFKRQVFFNVVYLKVQMMVAKLTSDKTGLSVFGIFIIDKLFILTVRH